MAKHCKTMAKFSEVSCQNNEVVGKSLLVFSQEGASVLVVQRVFCLRDGMLISKVTSGIRTSLLRFHLFIFSQDFKKLIKTSETNSIMIHLLPKSLQLPQSVVFFF